MGRGRGEDRDATPFDTLREEPIKEAGKEAPLVDARAGVVVDDDRDLPATIRRIDPILQGRDEVGRRGNLERPSQRRVDIGNLWSAGRRIEREEPALRRDGLRQVSLEETVTVGKGRPLRGGRAGRHDGATRTGVFNPGGDSDDVGKRDAMPNAPTCSTGLKR